MYDLLMNLAPPIPNHLWKMSLPFFWCAPKGYVGNACFQTLVHINTACTIYLRQQRRQFRIYTYLFFDAHQKATLATLVFKR